MHTGIRKINYLSAFLAAGVLLASCEKVMDVDEPDFEVRVKAEQYKVGEVVEFEFSGSVDLLSFYPGTEGHEYAYREQGKRFSLDSLRLEIVTSVSKNNQESTFSVLFSTSFEGAYTADGLRLEDWKDITDEGFVLATNVNDRVSPWVSLDGYFEEKKPFYIAFRYRNEPIVNTSRAVVWRLKGMTVSGLTADGWQSVSELDPRSPWSAAFTLVDFAEGTPLQGTSQVYADYIRIESSGGPTTAGNEIWAVTKAIDPLTLRLSPHRSIPVKSVAAAMPSSYQYVFYEAGVYEACFVARNLTADHAKEVVRKISVKIEEGE